MIWDWLISPFEYQFMRNALLSCVALGIGAGPVGVLLVLRRMSLMGDALSHAVLPGAALGYIVAGLSLPALSFGGFIAGLIVALLAGIVSRLTHLKEDASFAGFFLISLALGVLIISLRNSSIDLMNILFGSALAVDYPSLVLIAFITTFTLITLAVIYRPLIVECFDPNFFRLIHGHGSLYHILFLVLVVMNLVAGFQSMGTLLSLGIMMLPATSARFWAAHIWPMFIISVFIAVVSGYFGLLVSYHLNFPSGPCIVLTAGAIYIISFLFGSNGSFLTNLKTR